MIIFFDRCVPIPVVRALRHVEADLELVHLDEEFQGRGHLVSDEEWMPHVAGKQWVGITGDNKMRRRPAQRSILCQCGLRALFLPEHVSGFKLRVQAAFLLSHWEQVEKTAKAARPGECHLMDREGRFRLVWPLPGQAPPNR